MINCIYIHIPFCQKKCKYCSFCSFELIKEKNSYLNSLIKEIEYFYDNEKTKTIYLGGGTPSLLTCNETERILSLFNTDNKTEITIEVNPNTVDFEKLKQYKSLGINRISVGVQNFDDEILKTIGRNHSKKEIYDCIENIKKANIKNFSIDLMYGLPNQNLKQWEKTLLDAIALNPEHISLYGLKIEKGTYFYKFTPENLPSLDEQAKMYELAQDILKDYYIHYEFSSFAKNEKYTSKHNCAYWKRENYFGFGLSASGFIDDKRYTNTTNLKKYIQNPIKKEYSSLTKQQAIEEEIFLGLRLKEGIDFQHIGNKYGINVYKKYENIFKKFANEGFMEPTKNGIKLTRTGILVSNEILCEFIEV